MQRNKVKTDVYTFQSNTWQSKEVYDKVIQRAVEFLADPQKEKRLEEQECIPCFYSSKIGGCAMTSQPCGICEKNQMFGSTATDNFCKTCAKQHDLCKHCGGDVNLKVRRKVWLKE